MPVVVQPGAAGNDQRTIVAGRPQPGVDLIARPLVQGSAQHAHEALHQPNDFAGDQVVGLARAGSVDKNQIEIREVAHLPAAEAAERQHRKRQFQRQSEIGTHPLVGLLDYEIRQLTQLHFQSFASEITPQIGQHQLQKTFVAKTANPFEALAIILGTPQEAEAGLLPPGKFPADVRGGGHPFDQPGMVRQQGSQQFTGGKSAAEVRQPRLGGAKDLGESRSAGNLTEIAVEPNQKGLLQVSFTSQRAAAQGFLNGPFECWREGPQGIPEAGQRFPREGFQGKAGPGLAGGILVIPFIPPPFA